MPAEGLNLSFGYTYLDTKYKDFTLFTTSAVSTGFAKNCTPTEVNGVPGCTARAFRGRQHDLVRKPDALVAHVRFDERGTGNAVMGVGLRPGAKATEPPPHPNTGAPAPDSTIKSMNSAKKSKKKHAKFLLIDHG